jgi:hypothetical protein
MWLPISILVLAKATCAGCLAYLAYSASETRFKRLTDRMHRLAAKTPIPMDEKAIGTKEALVGAVRDLANPTFLLSFGLVAVFLFFSSSKYAGDVWVLLRPLAVGFLFFFVSRHPSFYRWLSMSRRYRPLNRLWEIFSLTKKQLQRPADPSQDSQSTGRP